MINLMYYYILPLCLIFSSTFLISKNNKIKIFTLKNVIVASLLTLTYFELKNYLPQYLEYLYYTLIFYMIISYLLNLAQFIFYVEESRVKIRNFLIFIAINGLLIFLTFLFFNIDLKGVFYSFDKYIYLVSIIILCILAGVKNQYENDDIFNQIHLKSKQIMKENLIIKKSNNFNQMKTIIVITIFSVIFISIFFITSSFIFYSGILLLYILIFYLNSFIFEEYLISEKIKFIIKENKDFVEKI